MTSEGSFCDWWHGSLLFYSLLVYIRGLSFIHHIIPDLISRIDKIIDKHVQINNEASHTRCVRLKDDHGLHMLLFWHWQ